MRIEVETDREGFLYIFGRYLKSQGKVVSHSQNEIQTTENERSLTLRSSEDGINVDGDTDLLIEWVEDMVDDVDMDSLKTAMRTMGFGKDYAEAEDVFKLQTLADDSLLAILAKDSESFKIQAKQNTVYLDENKVTLNDDLLRNLIVEDVVRKNTLRQLLDRDRIEKLLQDRILSESWRGNYYVSTSALVSGPSLGIGTIKILTVNGEHVRFSAYGDREDAVFRIIQTSESGVTTSDISDILGYSYNYASQLLQSTKEKYGELVDTTKSSRQTIYYSKLRPGWKLAHRYWGDSLHTMCSYLAMFPASMPHYFIKRLTKKGDVVLDPFCGRGTTVTEAILNDRVGIGNDLNPLASILSEAKANVPVRTDVKERINELEERYGGEVSIQDVPDKIKMLYSEYTLSQLLFLREELGSTDVDTFIQGAILGIMHGNSEGYLSISMPNTYSMSPNYVDNYIEKHGLEKPERDVFEKVRSKIDRIYDGREEIHQGGGRILNHDATKITEAVDQRPDLIFTSPPYLKLVNYGDQNWIRLWFLKENPDDVDDDLFATQSQEKYLRFMKDFLQEAYDTLKEDGVAVLVVGDVIKKRRLVARVRRGGDEVKLRPKVKQRVMLGEEIWEECARDVGFKKAALLEDVIADSKKSTKIWGEDRGQATDRDRLLVLSKKENISLDGDEEVEYLDDLQLQEKLGR